MRGKGGGHIWVGGGHTGEEWGEWGRGKKGGEGGRGSGGALTVHGDANSTSCGLQKPTAAHTLPLQAPSPSSLLPSLPFLHPPPHLPQAVLPSPPSAHQHLPHPHSPSSTANSAKSPPTPFLSPFGTPCDVPSPLLYRVASWSLANRPECGVLAHTGRVLPCCRDTRRAGTGCTREGRGGEGRRTTDLHAPRAASSSPAAVLGRAGPSRVGPRAQSVQPGPLPSRAPCVRKPQRRHSEEALLPEADPDEVDHSLAP